MPIVSVETEITPQPLRIGFAQVGIKLAASGGKPLQHAEINVEGDMSHPGMSPVFADAQELQPGLYQARLNLGMAGDWVVLLHVKLPGGQMIERQIDLKGVKAN